MNIYEAAEALLRTLPQCHACERPATRYVMSKHRTSVVNHYPPVVMHKGVSINWGSAFDPNAYTETWNCCDFHTALAEDDRLGVWDLPIAQAVRVVESYKMCERT